MVGTRRDYSRDAVAAAYSVLIELSRVLGQYRQGIVLVGGWVPELLLPGREHVGSIDVDLALDHQNLQDPGYATIRRLLVSRGYREGEQPFMFFREVVASGRTITVEVDLLAGEYAGTGPGHRTQQVQDVKARKARGVELALLLATEITISGLLPDGVRDSGVIRVTSIVPFLVMKGVALRERLKEKDAYDICFCLDCYRTRLSELAEAFRPHLGRTLVCEGLGAVSEKFASPEHSGPRFVADFYELADPEERALRARDAYELVWALLERLGFSRPA